MRYRNRHSLPWESVVFKICLLIALVIPAPGAALPSDVPWNATMTASDVMVAENGFAWKSAYDLSLVNQHVLVAVFIRLVPHAKVTPLELERVKPAWEAEIEKIWSNHFAVRMPDGRLLPVLIDVVFDAPSFHHQVVVKPGGGRSDQLNWKIMNSPSVAAHEFGHMIGAFDEYRWGATDPGGSILDPESIMSSSPSDGRTYERHYQGILSHIRERTGCSDAELVPIDGRAPLGS